MMTNKLLIPAVLLVTLGLTAPVSAGQARPRENGNRTKVTRQARPQRTAPKASARTPSKASARQNQPRQNQPRQVRPRATAPRQVVRPQVQPPRAAAPQRVAPRRDAQRSYAVPRTGRYEGNYRYDRDRRDDNRRYDRRSYNSRSYYYRPSYRVVRPYRPFYFPRSYFVFRPRVSIGFGFWLGYPVAYPYAYLGSYAPPVYGRVMPGVSVYGGLSFEISPYDAAVFVDGEYAGTVGQYPPNAPPLTLTPGPHRIEIQAQGFRPMMWDVTIVPGQVIPWQGAMQPF